jgi:hypothetical protein
MLTLILGSWIIWLAANASPRGDGGEICIVGIIMIPLALGGLWNMATSELDIFVSNEEV